MRPRRYSDALPASTSQVSSSTALRSGRGRRSFCRASCSSSSRAASTAEFHVCIGRVRPPPEGFSADTAGRFAAVHPASDANELGADHRPCPNGWSYFAAVTPEAAAWFRDGCIPSDTNIKALAAQVATRSLASGGGAEPHIDGLVDFIALHAPALDAASPASFSMGHAHYGV